MDYDVQKKLKDNGFHFRPASDEPMISPVFIFEAGGVAYSTPMLAELINACGEDFETLVRYEDATWRAYRQDGSEDLQNVSADTPEGAVSDLWLALKRQ